MSSYIFPEKKPPKYVTYSYIKSVNIVAAPSGLSISGSTR
jgi:hypothetical protein